jgi:hypothetical protein
MLRRGVTILSIHGLSIMSLLQLRRVLSTNYEKMNEMKSSEMKGTDEYEQF